MSELTQATQLSQRTLAAILARFPELEERTGPAGVLEPLLGPDGQRCGSVRLFEGRRIARLVFVGIDHEMVARHVPGEPVVRVDSNMIFAFTPAESLVPHFTLDAIYSKVPGVPEPILAYHLDLLPRVDVASNLAYLDHVYAPIEPSYLATCKLDGLSAPSLRPRQLALMSPFMLAHRSTAEAYGKLPVDAYLARWCELVEQGVPVQLVTSHARATLAERDRLHRASLFDPEVDPVWAQVERVIGARAGASIRRVLREQGSGAGENAQLQV